MLYKINHRTTYRYVSPVSVGSHVACLKPRSYEQNQVVQNSLKIFPEPKTLDERIDYFGNALWFFTIEEPHKELIVESFSEVLRTGDRVPDARASLPWEESTLLLREDHTPEGLDAYQYQFESPRIRIANDFAAYALESFTPGRMMLDALTELTSRIHKDFRFDSRVTTVRTTPEEVFKKRGGVCQDFAHVQIACLRSIKLAARYVSGYLRTYPPAGRPRLIGADASHAWISTYCRGAGWIDMDPTNDIAPTDGHVTLAWGRDYGDVSPLRGLILGGGSHDLQVEVDMEPIDVLPRIAF
ncbi:transglutaminase-like putative cysteine protease [Granulicella aggregans]|uniref:Transglutaminase-like putative cysteine protease n=1 Tax=Granulicella aggregans TaxID=474949 RepID=A0A7W8E1V7_9BACT|nr:transglutaminase family protein [Granulicella aggregans]MBB5056253.1 transglutaminase-like putative cysteine protease [Granulicella aggregans]